jgi:3-hydroxyisobutyrate dehydrogenase-like beta-hydroxyacid dehydrogenase
MMPDKGRAGIGVRMERVGLIGFGVMGAAMAPLLLEAGHELSVYDIDPGAAERARLLGCRVAATPAQAAGETTLLSLPRPEHVRAAVTGPTGVLVGTAPGGVVVDTSTVDPGTSVANAAAAAAAGVGYLDAPVLGRPDRVGRWTLPVGGEAEVLEHARPLLEVLAARIIHVGPSGRGNLVKLLNNLMFGAINAATAEVFALADRSGLPREVFFDAVVESGAATVSGLFRELGPKIVADDERVVFSLDNLEKDVALGLAQADAAGLQLEVAAAVQRTIHAGQAAGLGEQDTAALVRALSPSPAAEPPA